MSTNKLFALAALLGATSSLGCSEEGTPSGAATSSSGGGSGAGLPEEIRPDAPPLPGYAECVVRVARNIPIEASKHVEACAAVTYATNPPSGGDHDSTWAAYKRYSMPVRREHYVHNLEHGAVVLAYDCQGPCPEIVEALQKAADETPADPLCLQAGGETPARIVLTPDPKLDAPIAAAAWGATYTATCIDPPSLRAFVDAHYGNGPEATCAKGRDFDAEPLCP